MLNIFNICLSVVIKTVMVYRFAIAFSEMQSENAEQAKLRSDLLSEQT